MICNLKAEDQHQHKRGGGWIANTAQVDESVFVDQYAIVYGQAKLSEKVRVLGTAAVSGHAVLSGNVVVCGNCWIDGTFKAKTGVFRINEKRETKQVRLRPAEDGL